MTAPERGRARPEGRASLMRSCRALRGPNGVACERTGERDVRCRGPGWDRMKLTVNRVQHWGPLKAKPPANRQRSVPWMTQSPSLP